VAGGGIGIGDLSALVVHLACLGLLLGALALAVAAASGRKGVAIAVAAAYGVAGFLVNGFAPVVESIDWLVYLTPFHYYESSDPITNGIDAGHLAILLAATAVLAAAAAFAVRRRDLRG
jgi:ABC-2 type transport system permease protein